MAYGKIFTGTFSASDLTGVLEIYKKDYEPTDEVFCVVCGWSGLIDELDAGARCPICGASQTDLVFLPDTEFSQLKLIADSIRISYKWDDWESHVVGLTCEFEVLNNRDNYFELLTLLSAIERLYKVKVIINYKNGDDWDEYSLFEGFLNCDVNSQKYLRKNGIKLIASSYLSKLEYLYPLDIDTIQNMTFIDVISSILNLTGHAFPINVNCSLYAQGDTLTSAQTLFNKNGIYTELFWLSVTERMNGLEILEKILTSFNAYLYWQDGKWCIEQFSNIYKTGTSWVEYSNGVSYSPTDEGLSMPVIRTPKEIHTLKFRDQSQTLYVYPGYKKIQLNLDLAEGLALNLTLNDFSNTGLWLSNTLVQPSVREWLIQYPYPTWFGDGPLEFDSFGSVYKDIQNSIHRKEPTNAWEERTNPIPFGIFTAFRVTIEREISLNFSFKYGVPRSKLPISLPPGVYQDIKKYSFNFYYYIWEVGSLAMDGSVPTYAFLVKNDDGEWVRQITHVSMNAYNSYPYPAEKAIQNVAVDGSSFNLDNYTVEVTFSIPIGEVLAPGIGGDYAYANGATKQFVLGILIETCNMEGSDKLPAKEAYFGDVYITTQTEQEDDIIVGEINTDFLNTQEIDLLVMDVASLNYNSGILRGDTLGERTTVWTKDGVDFKLLTDVIFEEKFRMGNAAKQKIKSNIFHKGYLRLMDSFYDSKQYGTKKFVLSGFQYVPTLNTYENVELWEIDTDTEVTIVDGGTLVGWTRPTRASKGKGGSSVSGTSGNRR